MLFGFAGEGKSTIALDIAARGSIGRPMPDGYADYGGPFKVLLISYEDDAADTIKPRLVAAGGDPDRVLVVPGVSCDGDEPLLRFCENGERRSSSLFDAPQGAASRWKR